MLNTFPTPQLITLKVCLTNNQIPLKIAYLTLSKKGSLKSAIAQPNSSTNDPASVATVPNKEFLYRPLMDIDFDGK